MDAMQRRRWLSRRLGWIAGVGLVLVALAGADRPPPPGFLLMIGFGVLVGLLVARSLPSVLTLWADRGARPALARALAGGAVAGVVFGAVPILLQALTSSLVAGAGGLLIWFAVLGSLGALAAAGVAAVGRLLDRRAEPRPGA